MTAGRDYKGFESKYQLDSFLQALSAGKIPGKFAYLGAAAATQHSYALTKAYDHVTRSVTQETELLTQVWKDDLCSIDTFVDIGSGNGRHAVAMLRTLRSAISWVPTTYVAVDYSGQMAESAIREVQDALPGVNAYSNIRNLEGCGFEADIPLSRTLRPIYCLVGNTIGNVESIEATIEGMRTLAGRGARVLIGCALFNQDRPLEYYLAPYQLIEYRQCVLQPLKMIGIPGGLIDLVLQFNQHSRTMTASVSFKEDVPILGHNRRFILRSGTSVQCALSRRFLAGELPDLLAGHGVCIIEAEERISEGHGVYAVTL